LIHKSLEKEIISENDAKIMSKEQALQLIFAPGFSTAQEVTDISGRGVGMDVVRSSIQNLGGNVNIDSEVGLYTKIEFRIPLTMAIISALTVKIKQGEQFSTYAIPQTCISELVQINTKNVNNIKSVYNTLVFKIHGNILPLVFLSNILQSDYNNKSIDKEGLLDKSIVFISVDDKKFGIIIDEVIETQEIVVKSISHVFEQLKSISGATILGDGSVILIIDAAQIANIINFQQVYKASEQVLQDISQANQNETDSRQVDLLTFKTDETKCKSVELSNVDRLEEFMPQNIEHANGIYLIQYRGDLIPLYSFDQNFKPESTKQDQFIPTIIIRKNGQFIGLITHQIEDIVQYDGEFKEIGKHDYIKGVSVVNGRTLDIINTDYLFDYFNHETKVS
jgi:two-component system chemotaxis sensor kinase CheA